MKICVAFYCELQKSSNKMIHIIFFKHFWTNVSKLAEEFMITNFVLDKMETYP